MSAAPALRLAGYAALFDVADGARDTIRRGAFARTLRERREPLPLCWQHRSDQRIGTVESVREDDRGLRVIARVDDLRSRACQLLRQGALSGLSFGYHTRACRHLPQGRMLDDIELLEVSLVLHPLQPRARVHMLR